MGEFTCSKVELKDRTTFQRERPLMGDIEIKPSHAIFTLKRSKASHCTRSPPAARARLCSFSLRASLWEEGYTGHRFRKGAAQTALDRGLSKEDIQLLGRWSS
ncbi:hypothetical protein V8E54_007268 [Elaphomyces granulatus]